MASELEEIQIKILALSPEEKQEILRFLLDETNTPPDEEIERAWLLEAQRRHQEGVEGKVQYIPASVVFEKLRSRLKA